jgi:hypothetical protein
VLQTSEAVTGVLAFAGASNVLTLETLSATTHRTVRGLELELEGPVTIIAMRRRTILAQRADLTALRRAGTLNSRRLIFGIIADEGYAVRTADVIHAREGIVCFASPRMRPALATGDLIDAARSDESLDAIENLRTGLLGAGLVVVNVTAQKSDAMGMRNAVRLANSNYIDYSPPEGDIDDTVAAELIAAMAPIGGAVAVPQRLKVAATRDYGRNSPQAPLDVAKIFARSAAASAHLDEATLERVSTCFCWRKLLVQEGPNGMQIMLDDVSNDHDMTHRIARRLLREPEAECVGVLDVALICAVQYRKNLETVLLLLDHGAGVSELSTTTGGTAFHYAIYHYVEHLRKEVDPAYPGVVWSAAAAVARLLVERGVSLDIKTRAAHVEIFAQHHAVPAGSTARDIADACLNADVRATVLALIDNAVATRDAARAALTGT